MTAHAPGPRPDTVAVDYAVDGPRTAAAVASGRSKLVGMSYARAGEEPRFVAEGICDVLRDLGRHRMHHDSVFGLAIELKNDLPLPEVFDDTRIMLHLLEEDLPPELADQKSADPIACRHASLGRARCIASLYPQLAARIEAENLAIAYRQVEIPVVAPTLAMTLAGVPVNCSVLERIQASHEIQMEIARRQLAELVGREINIDSAEAVAALLYDEFALPAPAYTRGGRPTGVRALEELLSEHPAVEAVINYSRHKPAHAAAAGLLEHVDRSSQHAFAELDPLGMVTGRFSCSNPNIQGLPGPVLEAIEARPGHTLVEADFSQFELRVLAHFSQDRCLLESFEADDDVHRRTAAAVLGISEHEVGPEQRNAIGKRVNFSCIYGTTPVGLSHQLDISEYEAEQMLNAYFAAYPGVRQWADEVHDFVRCHGYVQTFHGRRRQLPAVWSADPGVAARGLRQAVNGIVQGSAAELLKLALVRLHAVLSPDVRMLMTCHDSVLLEVPADLVAETRRETAAAMEARPPGFTVPIKVDVAVGPTWAACKRRERPPVAA